LTNSFEKLNEKVGNMSEKIVVIGQGYVGLPLAITAARSGYSVVGYDTDVNKIASLKAKKSFIEDVTDSDLVEAIDKLNYLPSGDCNDLANFVFAIITVPTPLKDSLPDLTYVQKATELVGQYLTKGATVVLESTTYPGTTTDFMVPILESVSNLSAKTDFYVGFSPERIDPGNKQFNFKNTPKIVSGINKESLEVIDRFYSSIVDITFAVTSPNEAELAKLIENTFRHVNVALINELAIYANLLGINVWESIDAAKTKPFGFMPFYPGPGVGGHCLPIDPSYLSYQVKLKVGETFKFIELANELNHTMPSYVVRRVILGLNKQKKALNGSKVLAIGVSYKPNTSDTRESPAIAVINQLAELGAEVKVVDPLVKQSGNLPSVNFVELTQEVIQTSDIVLILSPHDVIDLELISNHGSYIFDLRRVIVGDNVEYL
jgi:UDP-N-acetyl-D-glucosamine dehydrogenase